MTVDDPSRLVSPPAGAVPASQAVLKLWGDEESGRVNDWIYVSNEKIQLMVFSMPPGARFGHSESVRTAMGADELYYVISGMLVLANPETGEVHRLSPGEALVFGRNTWHHGFAYGTETLKVLEFFAPPPATGSSQQYARTLPYLSDPTYVQDAWLERWPEAAGEAAAKHTQRPIGSDQVLWRLEGHEDPLLVGVYLSTPELTAGSFELLPGQQTDAHVHGGDEAGCVLEGRLNLFLPDGPHPDGPGNAWYQVDADDAWYVPEGTPHRYFNMTDRPVRAMFGVAPGYLPPDA